jgi:hypothetical protein
MSGKPYPKEEYVLSRAATLLQCARTKDKVVEVPRELPCNVIVVHGVNDVGTGYYEVEEGLCAGLQDRLLRKFRAATYKMPVVADKSVLLDDPDAVFFKRSVAPDSDTPVIPFYWGFREVTEKSKTLNGQKTDRNGNRLDKDLSKGGGPFGNATSTLPDMWNRGMYSPVDPVRDALRPLRTGPGRMYMVLAAQRLAALVSMIRSYEPKDTVNIVAHSQGCLVSLLAQALLMEMGERTADTLILTHPPYSVDEEMGTMMKVMTFLQGDKDEAMEDFYELIEGRQTIHARLQTLVNIVAGVAKSRGAEPAFASIGERDCGGMVHGKWKPDGDRDNRGKVYLYFCPEDMTVALDNMRGIGWQGVPDHVDDVRKALPRSNRISAANSEPRGSILSDDKRVRAPLAELGSLFHQRVFTGKLRTPSGSDKPSQVLVGQAPHDFVLRLATEDDHAHVVKDGRGTRASLPIASAHADPLAGPAAQRHGHRTINGEALKVPFAADIQGSQIDAAKIPTASRWGNMKPEDTGPCEGVDPIDAAIAVTGSGSLNTAFELMPPQVSKAVSRKPGEKPKDNMPEILEVGDLGKLTAAYNATKIPGNTDPGEAYQIIAAVRKPDGTIHATVEESPNTARKRWQNEVSPKSFHSVIFGSRKNHRHVTAYDLSIGSGKAASDPTFFAYLCAVADWRLKSEKSREMLRPGIMTWADFIHQFDAYYNCEPDWRRHLIKGNVDYYSSGTLPKNLPLLTGKLWHIIISEITSGERVERPTAPSRTSPGSSRRGKATLPKDKE